MNPRFKQKERENSFKLSWINSASGEHTTKLFVGFIWNPSTVYHAKLINYTKQS